MMRRWCALVLCIFAAVPASGLAGEPENAVRSGFTILLGFPLAPDAAGKRAQLIPGTLIPLDVGAGGTDETSRRQLLDRSLAFNRAAEKLWETFRLDPSRRPQKSLVEDASPGKQIEMPAMEGAGVRVRATLLSATDKAATFRVVFTQGDRQLADSNIVAQRGGRAVVGAMDGPSAPYIFLVVEPEAPGILGPGNKDVTQPVLITKVNPVYPPEAMKDKAQGAVVLEATVEVDGSITDIRALQDPDPRLTQAAIEALKQWRMQPARLKDGTAVAVRTAITINFQLR
jgi:TonB family protein